VAGQTELLWQGCIYTTTLEPILAKIPVIEKCYPTQRLRRSLRSRQNPQKFSNSFNGRAQKIVFN